MGEITAFNDYQMGMQMQKEMTTKTADYMGALRDLENLVRLAKLYCEAAEREDPMLQSRISRIDEDSFSVRQALLTADQRDQQIKRLVEQLKVGEALATAHFSKMKHDDPGKELYIQTVDKMRAVLTEHNEQEG